MEENTLGIVIYDNISSSTTATPVNLLNTIIHIYVFRTIYVIGFVGNIFSLVVWIRTKNITPPICFFISVCIADTLVLVTHMYEKQPIYVNVVCQMVHVIFLAIQIFAILLVVGMSVERYICVCRPMNGYAMTTRRTWKGILGLAVVALVASSLEGYMWTVNDGVCVVRREGDFRKVYVYTAISLFFTCPLIVIISLNVLVLYAVRKTRNRSSAYGRSMKKAKLKFNMTFHLVSLHLAIGDLLYAVVHLIRYTMYIQKEKSHLSGGRYSDYFSYTPLLITELISLSSYALDITLFTLSSHTFRNAALRVIRWRKESRKIRITRPNIKIPRNQYYNYFKSCFQSLTSEITTPESVTISTGPINTV